MIPENVRKAAIVLLGSLGAFIIALVAWLSGPGLEQPVPVPSPSVIVSVLPSPLIPAIELKLMRGMTDGFEVTALEAGPSVIDAGIFKATALEVRDVETLIPSFKGARVGKYGDALLPASEVLPGKRYWVDVAGVLPGTTDKLILGQLVRVSVEDRVFTWPVPVYMEMQFAQIARAHGLADEGPTFEARIRLAKEYHALLRAHGVEPIKSAVTVYPDTTFKNFKWNELILDNRIAPPCLFGPAPSIPPSIALLQAIETAIKNGALPSDSWVQAWDEGEGNAILTAQALDRVKLFKQYAPSLKVMVTRQASLEFNPYVDIYIPVINWFNQPGKVPASSYVGKTLGLYTSCMANSNCQNHTSADQVAPATHFPMMVLDAPETDAERFVTELVAAGAKQLLYFNTTQRMPTAFQSGGQYNEGGNGDGTLLYPNGGISKRMKFIRRGLNKVAWSK